MIINPAKSAILWPSLTEPPLSMMQGAQERGLCIERKSIQTLGTRVGLDFEGMAQWTKVHVQQTHCQLFKSLLNPALPVQCAMILLLNYLTRVTRPSILKDAAVYFDDQIMNTAITKLRLPTLSNVARLTLTMPIKEGGFGLRSMCRASPAAYYSAAAQAANIIYSHAMTLSPSSTDSKSPLPLALSTPEPDFVRAIYSSHSSLRSSGAVKLNVLPIRPEQFWDLYKLKGPETGLQKLISSQIEANLSASMFIKADKDNLTQARLHSIKGRYSGAWLTTIPSLPLLMVIIVLPHASGWAFHLKIIFLGSVDVDSVW